MWTLSQCPTIRRFVLSTSSNRAFILKHYRKGHAVELGDALIAACAVLNRATLWTLNRRQKAGGVSYFFS